MHERSDATLFVAIVSAGLQAGRLAGVMVFPTRSRAMIRVPIAPGEALLGLEPAWRYESDARRLPRKACGTRGGDLDRALSVVGRLWQA
jgi:hypothetical protein